VRVSPGDVVLVDEDGVVVVPRGRAAEVLAQARTVAECEATIFAEMRAGVALPRPCATPD